jgi:hypothetical protein
MSDVQPNPYAPPHAQVRDIDPDRRPLQKPQQVRLAVALLWVSLALGPLNLLLDDRSPARTIVASQPALLGLMAGVLAGVLALMAVLVVFIYRGRNWARVVYLVMYLLGALPWLLSLPVLFGHSPVAGAVYVVQGTIQAIALYFIFSQPGSAWFRYRT